MRKLLIGLVLSLVATAASAEWVLAFEAGTGEKFYANPTTKKRTGDTVRIWELQDFSKPAVLDGKPVYSIRLYRQYDCAERTGQSLQTATFAGNMAAGESLGISTQPGTKRFIAPGTAANAMLNFACK